MRSRTKIRSCATILGLLYILLLDPAFVTSAPVSVEEGDYDVESGCYYMLDLYKNGEQIRTNEPCLNCTCSNNMLMCYLKTCPFTKPIGSDCKVERIPGLCCPIIKCPEVGRPQVSTTIIPVSHQPISPVVGGITTSTALSLLESDQGCYANQVYYPEGSQVSSSTADPCDLCYCIRNHTACVKQRCVLDIPGCTPKFREGLCCPVGYDCEELTTTSTTTTTTTALPSTGCYVDDEFHYDGSSINTGEACNHCYCLQGKVVCAIQECDPPVDRCLPVLTDDHCCPFKYDCSSTFAPSFNDSGDFSTTPGRFDDDAAATASPDVTLSPTAEEEASPSETTTAFNIEPEQQPQQTTLSPQTDDQAEATTETEYLIDERFKTGNSSLKPAEDQPHIPVVILPAADKLTTLAPVEREEEKLTTTEDISVIDTTVKSTEEPPVKLPEPVSATVQPLKSDSQVLEGHSSTTLPTADVEAETKEAEIPTTIASGPIEIETTQQPIVEQEAATTAQALNDFAVYQTTSQPQAIEPDVKPTTASPKDQPEDTVPEYTTESPPQIEAVTTEKSVVLDSGPATTEESIKVDTTAAKVEDEESNLVEEPTRLAVKPTPAYEIKHETPEQEVIVATTQISAETRFDLTESPGVPSADEPHGTATAAPEDAPKETEKVSEVTTEPPVAQDAQTPAAEERTELPDVTELPVELTTEEATSRPVLLVTQSNVAPHLDSIPGEGDCLQAGVTYSSGANVPSDNLCHENCTCNNSIISCDKIRCEKPASFRHLVCTELFEDKSCCPRYICADSDVKGPGVLESGSLVTVAPPASDDAPSTAYDRLDETTALPIESTSAPLDGEVATSKPLIIREQVTTSIPDIVPEIKPEVTTAAPEDVATELPEQQPSFDDHRATTEEPDVKPEDSRATTEPVKVEEPEVVVTTAASVDAAEDDVYTTPKLEVIDTTSHQSADEPPPPAELSTTEKPVEETTVPIADKVTTKLPYLPDVDLATTPELPKDEVPIETTIRPETITELPDIETTVSQTERPADDQPVRSTELIDVTSPPASPTEEDVKGPIALNETAVQRDEIPETTLASDAEVESTTAKVVEETVDVVKTPQPEIVVPEEEEEATTAQSSSVVDEATPSHDVGYVTEEILQTESAPTATDRPIIVVDDQPQRENPTTRISISVEVVTPEPIVTTDSPSIASEEEVKVNVTKESTPAPSEEPPKVYAEVPKPEEQPVETTDRVELTTPIAVTEGASVEDDDPRQTVEISDITTIPPTVDDEINEILATTSVPVKEKEEPTTPIPSDSRTEAVEIVPTTAKMEVSDELTTTVKEKPTTLPPAIQMDATTSLPEQQPIELTTIKLASDSQVTEEIVTTTTVKYIPSLNESIVTRIKIPSEAQIIEHNYTTTTLPPIVTTLLPITTTLPPVTTALPTALPPVLTTLPPVLSTLPPVLSTLPPVLSTLQPVLTTAAAPPALETVSPTVSVPQVVSTVGTAPPTSTEKATTTATTVSTTTSTLPPTVHSHLPADERVPEGEDDAPPDHEHEYYDHTEDDFSPDLGIPITSSNFTIDDGDCVYDSRLYRSAQQIPREDPCDFCFCFRGDIICLQQSCPPPIDGCYEETIPGFCCPRFECPITAVTLNVSDTKVPYPVSASRYRSVRAVPQVQVVVCEFRSKFYSRGESIKAASSPCMDCLCGDNGTMKCTPKKCQLDPFWHSLHGLKKTDKIDTKRAGRNRY